MTKEERRTPEVLNGSRRKRIALGSGTTVQEVNQLMQQFGEMRTMVRQMSTGKGKWAQMARQFGGGGGMPGLPEMGDTGNGSMQGLPRPGGGKGKKTGKAARKEKRRQKAKSGRGSR
jgi:signal recognition particle subunit SRP54